MIVRARDVVSPVPLDSFAAHQLFNYPLDEWPYAIPTEVIWEAAPHYTGIRIKWMISGEKAWPVENLEWYDGQSQTTKYYTRQRTDSYDYTKEITFSRATYMTGLTGPGKYPTTGGIGFSESYRIGEETSPPFDPDTQCHLLLAPALSGKYSPVWQAMEIGASWTGYGEGWGEVIGQESWAYSGDKDPGDNLPAEDIIEPVWLYPPSFYAHEAPANPLDCPFTRWGDPNWPVDLEMSLDITGWTRANWRDLRGAHSFTVADEDGIERTWEWEIF